MLLSKSAPLLSSLRSSTTVHVSGDDRGDGDDVLEKAGKRVVLFLSLFSMTQLFLSAQSMPD